MKLGVPEAKVWGSALHRVTYSSNDLERKKEKVFLKSLCVGPNRFGSVNRASACG